MAPVTTTINPAPADNLTSLTGTVNPDGAPLRAGLVEKLYWVFAIQIGSFPYPLSSKPLSWSLTALSMTISSAR